MARSDREHRYRLRDAIAALREPPPDLSSPEQPKVPGNGANAEAVSWMVSEAEGHLAEQEARLESLRGRAAQLAGFAGLLLGLLAALAPGGFAGMSDTAHFVAAGTFVVALALLLAGILISLLFVVRPTRTRGIKPAERIDGFLRSERELRAEPWQLQLRTLRAFPGILKWHAWLNRRRAAALYVAYLALATGLLASAVCVGTIGVDAGRTAHPRPAAGGAPRAGGDTTGRAAPAH